MLVLLQLDAMSLAVLERVMGEREAGALADLRRRGQFHRLETPATYIPGAAAQTLHTGTGPGEHGVYYPFLWAPWEQRVRFKDRFPGLETVWDRLAAAGRRSLIIDPYDARAPRSVEGICVSGCQLTNRVALARWSRPRSARRRLERRFGRAPLADEVFGRPSPGGLARFRQRLLEAADRVASVATELLARERFDLAWINFAGPHLAGHQFWDVRGLVDSADDRRLLEGTLDEVYASVDPSVGRILDALPRDADVIVLSPLGMGPDHDRTEMLPGMLAAALAGGDRAPSSRPNEALWRLRAAVPTSIRAAAARALPDPVGLELTARLALLRTDWSRTPAFALPSDQVGYVRLNVRGRERDGIVDPAHTDELLAEIGDGLRTFSYPDGAPAVAGVDRVRDVVGAGTRSDLLPDLVVWWSDRPAERTAGFTSPRFGDVAALGGGTGRSGNHTDEAWALVVPGASQPREPARAPRVADLPVTACSLLGADTEGMEGEPLLETGHR
jgi:predicted AlkP superfamily phosphohydrolase/phosphomutase